MIKEVDRLKFEIKVLEWKIQNYDLISHSNNIIKNLKVYSGIFRSLAPYLLTVGIVTSGFKIVTGTYPFYRDDIKKYSHIKSELDSLGHIKYEQQYDAFDNETNLLYHYSKWYQKDNKYYRTVDIYEIKKLSEDNIIELLNSKDINLESILGKRVSSNIEENIYVNENNEYFEAILYNEDKNDYIVVKEAILKNILCSILYIFVLELIEMVPFVYCNTYSKFDLKKYLNDVESRECNFTKNNLIKLLKIKKQNYERLSK